MAVRKPLVTISGQIQELPAGDSIGTLAATDWPVIKNSIPSGETCSVPAGYQMIVETQLNVDGTISNDGEVYVEGEPPAETGATIREKLGVITLSGSNTGDQTTIAGITGTIAQFNTACTDADFATGGGTATGTNTGDEAKRIYARFDEAAKDADVTISKRRLTYYGTTASSGQGSVRATISKSGGKWRADFFIVSNSHSLAIGMVNSSSNLGYQVGLDAYGVGYFSAGYVYKNGAVVATSLVTFAAGDVISLEHDAAAGTVQWFKNNTPAYTAAGADVPSGALYMAVGFNGNGASEVDASFTDLYYQPTSGFNAGVYTEY